LLWIGRCLLFNRDALYMIIKSALEKAPIKTGKK